MPPGLQGPRIEDSFGTSATDGNLSPSASGVWSSFPTHGSPARRASFCAFRLGALISIAAALAISAGCAKTETSTAPEPAAQAARPAQMSNFPERIGEAQAAINEMNSKGVSVEHWRAAVLYAHEETDGGPLAAFMILSEIVDIEPGSLDAVLAIISERAINAKPVADRGYWIGTFAMLSGALGSPPTLGNGPTGSAPEPSDDASSRIDPATRAHLESEMKSGSFADTVPLTFSLLKFANLSKSDSSWVQGIVGDKLKTSSSKEKAVWQLTLDSIRMNPPSGGPR